MQFDYDPAKRQINIEKHGVDFLEVGLCFWTQIALMA
jgi:uncharacterized DUF497 family protein